MIMLSIFTLALFGLGVLVVLISNPDLKWGIF